MKKCPACGKETLVESNDIRYCGDGCGFVQEINPPESTRWLLAISANKEYWKSQFFEKLPVFIAHEYRRLWLMTCRPNVFCMVYQLKDVGEILLKFPVLCAAAYLNDDAVSSLLVKKVLSIGDWKDIASTLIGKYNGKPRFELPECLRNILTGIKKIYDQTDIAYYRNDYLAHGAMGFEDNADYREFGEKLIARISAYLTDVMQYYAQLKVTLGGMELAGWKLPENCSPDDELTLHFEGHEIPLYPYIAHNEKEGVLFFDYYSASRNNQIAKGLNYIRGGGRKSFVAPYYCEVYERHFGGEIQKISDSMNKSLERNNSTLEIEKVLNELNEADNFVRPEYIIHWMENWLNDDKGSIHLLMMERGMGKTALSYALASGKVDPGDVTVCAYYCGQSGMRGDYISGINNALTGDIVRVQNRRMSHGQSEESEDFIRLKYDAEDKHANMTETLEYFRDEHAYFHQKSKLLLIMDGVDELPRESAGLFDYIPSPEEMPDNTYILITSRNPVKEKLPAHITGAIEQFNSIDTMLVSSDIQGDNGENNHCVLRDYATTKVRLLDGGEMRKLSEDEAEHLIQLSGGIFLNLKLYAKLAESGIPVKSLPALDSQPLFKRYLKEIQKYYGDKLFDEAMTVLYAIVTAEEPLTLREVAWLSGEEYITPKLLAFLRDFGALLRTMRVQSDIEDAAHNPRGSLINPASELYTPYIKALFPEKQKELAAIFADKLMNTDLEQYKDANGNYSIPDGLFYIAAYLPKVTDEISEELRDRVYIKDRERTDIYDCVTKNKNSRDSYVLKRLTKMGEVWSEYCKKAGWYEKQIGFLNIIGNSYSTMCEYDQALEWKNQQVALCQQYLSEGRMDDENDLATAYMNRGVTYDDMGKYEEALKDYDQCIAIMESLHEAGRLYDENDLASAYLNRGVTYDDMGKYEEALKDYDKCIAIRESLHEAGRLYDENALAKAYMSRGVTYDDMGKYEEALKDYDQCIAIMESLHEAGRLYDENDLATAYMNRGVTYWSTGKYEEALKDYGQCIAIMESLHEAGRLYDDNYLAKAYMNRGNALGDVGKHEEALQDYGECIRIRESLHEAGRLYDENDLASAYMNRGVTYRAVGKYEEALKDYGKCIAIRESLHEAGRLYEENDLASAYMNRGNTYSQTGKYEEVLKDYGKCIAIMESLHETGRLYDENDLATAYMNRGVTYSQTGKYEEALKDYGKCIAIMESLHEASRLYDENDLATAYMNRGLTYEDMGKYEEALKDYSKCIAIMESLHEAGRLYDPNDLAGLYLSRCLLYRKTRHFDEALHEIEKALSIRFELHKQNRLYDIIELANDYLEKGNTLAEGFNRIDEAVALYHQATELASHVENPTDWDKGVIEEINEALAKYEK